MGRQETNTRRPPPKDRAAEGLGWFSLGLGSAQLIVPATLCRLSGIGDGGRNRALMRARGLTEVVKGLAILTRPKPTGWLWGRVAGDALDLTLLANAARDGGRRTRVAVAIAAVGGVTAADLAESTRLSRSDTPPDKALRVKKAVTVNRPAAELYAFWRRLEQLADFMTHLESVEALDGNRSRWRAKGPAGTTVEWDAEIVEERPNELISWQSLPGSSVTNSGTVRFEPAPGGRGTEVHVELTYEPPAGTLGATFAKLLGEEPATQLADDLRRFKQVVETGDVVRSDASLHGHGLAEHLKQRAAQPPTQQQAREAVRGGAS